MSKTYPAAFFDLDGTLFTVNTMARWMQHEYALGRITLTDALNGAFYTFLYRYKSVDILRLARKALGTMRGQSEQEFRSRITAWFRGEMSRYRAPGALKVIEEHRRAGHPLVILTSASNHAARVVAEDFGLDDYISTRLEVTDGTFTGEPELPLCFGPGKVELAEAYAAKHSVDLDVSYFYTDSFTDLPMLQRVGFPRIVAPDLRLRAIARWRKWPILDWSRA